MNKQAYLREMNALLAKAQKRWQAKKNRPPIFAIAVWTDPQAQASAVNIDTRRKSDAYVRHRKAFAEKEIKSLLKEGDRKMAALFREDLKVTRNNDNPADFEFVMLAEISHRGFSCDDEADEKPLWKELRPLLRQVQKRVLETFKSFEVEPDAEVAINAPMSWYAHPVRLKGVAPGVDGVQSSEKQAPTPARVAAKRRCARG